MAKKPPSKETIKPPTKKELTDAAKQLRQGHSSAGRVLAEKATAVKQAASGHKGVRDSSPPPKPPRKK